MATTVPGGIYKDAAGNGYHDANGKPLPAPVAPVAVVPLPAPPPAVPANQPLTKTVPRGRP